MYTIVSFSSVERFDLYNTQKEEQASHHQSYSNISRIFDISSIHILTTEMPQNRKLLCFALFGAYLFGFCHKIATGFAPFQFENNPITPMKPPPPSMANPPPASSSSVTIHTAKTKRRQRYARLYSSSTAPAPQRDAINGEGNAQTKATHSLFWPSNQKRKKPSTKLGVGGPSKILVEDDDDDYYDEIFDSIVKIYATHNAEPDTTMPWQKGHSYTSYSSGFIIDQHRILTNAHSVEYAGQVLVRRRGSSKKYRATVEVVANECDLAILSIQDELFWTSFADYDDDDEEEEEETEEENDDDTDKEEVSEQNNNSETNVQCENENDEETANTDDTDEEEDEEDDDYDEDAILPLEFGELPELQDEVEVLGYPTGGDSLSVTKGVVSRIEATEYAQCSGSNLLAIQIDAAINGGNSGGPVVDASTGKVVGVAFQSLDEAENIGYVVPVTVVLHFLEDIRRHGKYTGTTCLGIRFAKLENESMRKYLKLPEEDNASKKKKKKGSTAKGGVMVRSCFPTCPSKDFLKENDVILSIDEIPVASDGNVPFRRNGRERVSFASYVQTKFADETVTLDLWRNGGPTTVEVPLAISKDLVPPHWDNQAPPYLIVGGLVFSVLSVPYLEDCNAWGDYVSDDLSYLANKVNDVREHEDDQVVILINVLAHPKNTGYDGLTDMHLLSCNGTKVRSLKHLQELLQAEEDKGEDDQNEYLQFQFGSSWSGKGNGDGGTLVVLETDSLKEIEKDVKEEHAIQNSFYFPPSPTI